MRTPHTQYCRGKRVYVLTRAGVLHVGKFVERTNRLVVLDNLRIEIRAIKGMGLWKAQQNMRTNRTTPLDRPLAR